MQIRGSPISISGTQRQQLLPVRALLISRHLQLNWDHQMNNMDLCHVAKLILSNMINQSQSIIDWFICFVSTWIAEIIHYILAHGQP